MENHGERTQRNRTTLDTDRRTYGNRLAVDASGSAYIVGTEALSIDAGVPSKLSLWKFDPAGDVEWQRRDSVPATGRGAGHGIGVLPSGNLLVTGRRFDDAAGVHLQFAPDGTELAREERPTDTGELPPLPFTARDFVVDGVDGFPYTLRTTGGRAVVSKFAVGGPIGANYCGPAVLNSTGQPGSIDALGGDTAQDDNVTVLLSDLPPGTLAMVVASTGQGSVPMAGGSQGTLCLSGAIGRYAKLEQIRRVCGDGTSSLRVNLTEIPQPTGTVAAMAGQTWNFQAWFRDANPAVTSNFTDGVSVTLQ